MIENNETNVSELDSEVSTNEQREVRKAKLHNLKKSGNDPFRQTKFPVDNNTANIVESFETLEGTTVSIAGRVMSWRDMGKANFIDVMDRFGRLQCYVRKDAIGDDNYVEFKTWDIGDIVGISGEVFRTKRGEISIKVESITLLAKALLPLPEKYHGLKDVELRYRKRYVDLIVNPEVRETFKTRSAIIKTMRNYLDELGFMEVETPILQSIAGGAAARPFVTHHNTLDMDMYLRIAHELYLKRLIVGGFDKVYEIGRAFRNEGISVRHNPEFTMMELYWAFADYQDIMNLTENIIKTCAVAVLGDDCKTTLDGVEYDLSKPFNRASMKQLVLEHSGVDFSNITTVEQAREQAKKHGIEFSNSDGVGKILNYFFETFCEDKLIHPTFVTGHPVEISPLSKRDVNDPDYTERFELFIGGREYANAFSELNDPEDQRERFLHQVEMKALGDEEACDFDSDYINALEYGLAPTGGLGIGIDRLVMLLTGSSSIRDVILFPAMRSVKED